MNIAQKLYNKIIEVMYLLLHSFEYAVNFSAL